MGWLRLALRVCVVVAAVVAAGQAPLGALHKLAQTCPTGALAIGSESLNASRCVVTSARVLRDGWMDGWMGGLVDGWMGGRVDGWMDGWMDGWKSGCVPRQGIESERASKRERERDRETETERERERDRERERERERESASERE